VSPHGEDRARARYARAIEARLAERLERPLVLSPRDWSRISDWHGRGIPLALVLESIDAAFEPKRRARRARPPGLAYIAALVDESWRVVVDGRRVPAERSAPSVGASPLDAWRKRLLELPRGSALSPLLERLIRGAERGRPLAEVDAELDRELGNAIPSELALQAVRAAEIHVERLRGRLSAEEIGRAQQASRIAWLRRRLALPRLVS
jgi:hypothetical protein